MTVKIHKVFWAWQNEKEELWLNAMSEKGYQLISVGFCTYVFERSDEQYGYRIELLESFAGTSESSRYVQFLAETGVEYVGSVFRWAYFRKKKTEGEFELFSDNTSRIRHLKRILGLMLPLMVMNLGVGTQNMVIGLAENLPVNVWCSCASFIVTFLLGYGCWKIYQKKKQLESDQMLFER